MITGIEASILVEAIPATRLHAGKEREKLDNRR